MKSLLLLTLALVTLAGAAPWTAASHADVASAISCPTNTPEWANRYVLDAALVVPSADLRESLHLWYDSDSGNSRVDYYGGTTSIYQLAKYPDDKGSYSIVAPITTEDYANVKTCLRSSGNRPIVPYSVIPQMDNYTCVGNDIVNGVWAQRWTYTIQSGDVVKQNTMWLHWVRDTLTNGFIPTPVLHDVKGLDHYYVEFFNYEPKKSLDDSVFEDAHKMKCMGVGELIQDSSSHPINTFLQHHETHMNFAWQHFLHYHNKVYSKPSEHAMRKDIFMKNHRLVHTHNNEHHSYKLAMNHFADWTQEELDSLRGSYVPTQRQGSSRFPYLETEILQALQEMPANLDWRLQGAVTPVKNQFDCGSCWSFSTTGAIEGAHFLKTGNLLTLSEQALMDCSWGFGNGGCNGGMMDEAFKWVKKHGGLPLENDYPYLSVDGRCHYNETKLYAQITGHVDVPIHDEAALRVAIFKNGPVSIAIDASPRSFVLYASGVYDDATCSPMDLDHGVLAVGYGVLNGKAYWLVKNSWGEYWGEGGYILIAVKNNVCGVTTSASYVTM